MCYCIALLHLFSIPALHYFSLSPLQVKLVDTLLKLGPLGLELPLTPSFLDFLDKKLSYNNCEPKVYSPPNHYQAKVNDFGSQPISEKLKASNFCASLLRIGTWEVIYNLKTLKYGGSK